MLVALKKLQQSIDEQSQEQARLKTKVDLAMTNLTLVQQEQVNFVKLLNTTHLILDSSTSEGVTGSQLTTSRFPPSPPPPPLNTSSVRFPFPPPPPPADDSHSASKHLDDVGNQ